LREKDFGGAIRLSDPVTIGNAKAFVGSSPAGALIAVVGSTNEGSMMEPKWKPWMNLFVFSATGDLQKSDVQVPPGRLLAVRMLGARSARFFFVIQDHSGNSFLATHFWLAKRFAREPNEIPASKDILWYPGDDLDGFAWYEQKGDACVLRMEIIEATAKRTTLASLAEPVPGAVCPRQVAPKTTAFEVMVPPPRRAFWQFWCPSAPVKDFRYGIVFLVTPRGGLPYEKTYSYAHGRLTTPEGLPAPKPSEAPRIAAPRPSTPARLQFHASGLVLRGERL
jgi:hypothetical protein